MALDYRMRELHKEVDTLGFLDMTITEINHISALKSGMNTAAELVVTGVRLGSSAHCAGVENGDIISEVNGKPVITLEDLENSLVAHEPGAPIRLLFRRVGMWRFTTLPVV